MSLTGRMQVACVLGKAAVAARPAGAAVLVWFEFIACAPECVDDDGAFFL
jgi:hypothetical protein